MISCLHRKHRAVEFKKILAKIASQVPHHLDVHLVCDNYGLGVTSQLGLVRSSAVELSRFGVSR